MPTLVYVRDADLRKVQEFQAECVRRDRNFSYRNPTYFEKPELFVELALVDARYPHIAEAYEKRGVSSRIIDFKNVDIFSFDDFLELISIKEPGLPNGGSEGDSGRMCDPEAPQVLLPVPESPALSPEDDEEESELSAPAVESISPVPDVSSPRSRRRNVRRIASP